MPFAPKEKSRGEATNMQVLQARKLEGACVKVLKERYQTIEEILAYFWDCHFNRKEIEKCFGEILPAKVRKYFKLTPHYLFLLHSDASKIIAEIG
jgi:hypothetical protein